MFENQHRSLSPPRSSNSSGYGTGSSRKSSYMLPPGHDKMNVYLGKPKVEKGNSSSGNSGDERWYDFGDVPPSSNENSPPPLPNRLLGGGKGSAFQKVSNTSNVIINGNSVLSNVTVNNGHNSSSNNSNTSSPSIYQHPPPPKVAIQQQKQQRVTRKFSYPVEEKREAKVTYLTEFELNNQPNIGLHHSKNDMEQGNKRYHMRSEDELSAVSTSKFWSL